MRVGSPTLLASRVANNAPEAHFLVSGGCPSAEIAPQAALLTIWEQLTANSVKKGISPTKRGVSGALLVLLGLFKTKRGQRNVFLALKGVSAATELW